MKIPILPFDPRKDGLDRWLPKNEAMLIAILWDLDKPATVKHLRRLTLYQYHHSTIGTTLNRLVRKGLLKRSYPQAEKHNIACTYTPICTIDEFYLVQEQAIFTSLRLEYTNAENSLC